MRRGQRGRFDAGVGRVVFPRKMRGCTGACIGPQTNWDYHLPATLWPRLQRLAEGSSRRVPDQRRDQNLEERVRGRTPPVEA